MNREIRYRGQRVDNGEWIYGFLFELNADGSSVLCIGTEPLSANDYSEIYSSCYGEVIPETVDNIQANVFLTQRKKFTSMTSLNKAI